jgi:hypothetical protein
MAQVPERLNLEQCADLLGIERGEPRAHMGSLAQHAAGRDRLGRPFWHLEDVYRWAAQTLPATADRIPVTFWPKAAAPAGYFGGACHRHRGRRTGLGDPVRGPVGGVGLPVRPKEDVPSRYQLTGGWRI